MLLLHIFHESNVQHFNTLDATLLAGTRLRISCYYLIFITPVHVFMITKQERHAVVTSQHQC